MYLKAFIGFGLDRIHWPGPVLGNCNPSIHWLTGLEDPRFRIDAAEK
jgi:hypothetical protein